MDHEEIRKQIAAYCKTVPAIAACYLFGSFAAGSNRAGSDLDLAFLLTPEIPPGEFGTFKDRMVTGLGRLTRLVVHPVVMNNAGELVLGQIFRKGVCIYEADEAVSRAFRRNKLPLVAEFSYYSEMMLSAQKKRYGAEADG